MEKARGRNEGKYGSMDENKRTKASRSKDGFVALLYGYRHDLLVSLSGVVYMGSRGSS